MTFGRREQNSFAPRSDPRVSREGDPAGDRASPHESVEIGGDAESATVPAQFRGSCGWGLLRPFSRGRFVMTD